jgi:hypothetical protein
MTNINNYDNKRLPHNFLIATFFVHPVNEEYVGEVNDHNKAIGYIPVLLK